MYDINQYNSVKVRDMVNCECDFCGKLFSRIKRSLYKSLKRGSNENFCSRGCAHKKEESHTPKANCLNCGEAVKASSNKFCSKRCSNIILKKKRVPLFNCKHCGKNIDIIPSVFNGGRTFYRKGFCSSECMRTNEGRIVGYKKFPFDCLQCKKTFLGIANKKEGQRRFCSKSCRMTYHNANFHIAKKSNKSRPEQLLAQKISDDFPFLKISRQDRDFLPSRLELDMLFHEIRFAIEVNGPVHYMPIYGEKGFEKTKLKDGIKNLEASSLGISLLTVDVSTWTSHKTQRIKAEQVYQEVIKPLIIEKLRSFEVIGALNFEI